MFFVPHFISLFMLCSCINDVTVNYWKGVRNRRRFFDNVAKEFKFDPLVAANWYKVTVDNLQFTKVGRSRVI